MARKKSSRSKSTTKSVETITHDADKRTNIPTAEYQPIVPQEHLTPVQVAYQRRNRDLDPQLVWRGKDEQDWSDLVVHAPPLYIQEKVHPKALIDDLLRQSKESEQPAPGTQLDLFADFNGVPDGDAKTEFYQHDANWTNRMILGDSLQVMASLAEREGLRGKVQCIYLDPPYGIKFNSNFQWSTTSRDVKDGKADHITREPEQVKAFRDTWRDGIHSYLTYLRDRLTVARDLLHDTGSIFVQIGDENVHRVRAVMDEVFGDGNFVSLITFKKTHYLESDLTSNIADYLLVYAKSREHMKFRKSWRPADIEDVDFGKYRKAWDENGDVQPIPMDWRDQPKLIPDGWRPFRDDITLTQDGGGEDENKQWSVLGQTFRPGLGRHWRTHLDGMNRLLAAGRVNPGTKRPFYIEGYDDSPSVSTQNIWTAGLAGAQHKVYVVQTNIRVVQACLLMATDPGDLVLDPTCGSGTTAYVAEQWGRRWITVDTSRVALALARARIMGARYPYYLLADSPEGQQKEAEVTRTAPSTAATHGNIRHGFVYERVPHITLKSIANNAEIDVIWEKFEETLAPLREQLTAALPDDWLDDYRSQQKYTAEVPPEIQEWEIPREFPDDWPDEARALHEEFWKLRIERQREIDASIAAKADHEYLYDKPYEDKKKVRVAGPFTVESLSPHRTLGVDENDELIDPLEQVHETDGDGDSFDQMILENLKTAGVQQAHKEDRITFTSLAPWPGDMVCAEGHYMEGETERRAGIFIGPEFGTVQRQDLVQATREAGDAGFDVLIACAFNYEAHATDFSKLGRIPVLKARMNADLHMADDLKNTGKGNLFVIFGEPDIEILDEEDGRIRVKVNGVDVFHPNTGEVRSDGADGIACWFVDTDYNEESFFVRQAYFLGASDPYKSLKTTLKAEINAEAWETLYSDTSRPFRKPKSGRIAVKVINHLGDEVMKVFRV
ncbi:site-specific DNA-methyltransferase [Maioricimonas sp. JC845]|uniref:site-specific DNA-methyltransferase n=1 Tax=Maioricimonas sp. JC845 TaxID=3232138 RepID=UPI00345AEC15